MNGNGSSLLKLWCVPYEDCSKGVSRIGGLGYGLFQRYC